ncbi:MAG: hypothetical protein MUD03_11210, partial [Pirellula sp.]|nr:hypothetical protein [Pirellula sp.]
MKTAHLHRTTGLLSLVFASLAGSAAVAQRPELARAERPESAQSARYRVANHASEVKQAVAPIHRSKPPRGDSTTY